MERSGEMKKKTLLNAIIITLSIISGVSIIIAGFVNGGNNGFITLGCVSAIYTLILFVYNNLSRDD